MPFVLDPLVTGLKRGLRMRVDQDTRIDRKSLEKTVLLFKTRIARPLPAIVPEESNRTEGIRPTHEHGQATNSHVGAGPFLSSIPVIEGETVRCLFGDEVLTALRQRIEERGEPHFVWRSLRARAGERRYEMRVPVRLSAHVPPLSDLHGAHVLNGIIRSASPRHDHLPRPPGKRSERISAQVSPQLRAQPQ